MTAEIHDRTRDGLLEIVGTSWDSNGTLDVTVRELIGDRACLADTQWRDRARRLARRAIHHPDLTRSAATVRTFWADGSTHWTFAVSRNERY